MNPSTRPDHTEAGDYYFTYINQVAEGDILRTLDEQLEKTLSVLRGVSEEQSLFRYAPGKWSLRQVVAHVADTERVFAFRALWFARGFASPLPSFDQEPAVAASGADQRSWASLVEEFRAVRQATSALFRNLPPAAWSARGVASGKEFTVHALAYIAAGHVEHHMRIVRERYLKK